LLPDYNAECRVKVVTPIYLGPSMAKMTGNTDLVAMEYLQKMGHDESNGQVLDDVACAGLVIRN